MYKNFKIIPENTVNFVPLRDEPKDVTWILNDNLHNDFHFPESFSGEQIIIKILCEACSTNK
jgi:hypothetical protein